MKCEKKKCTAIVLAAGSGKRMGTATPKQFLELEGRPLVYYALACFQESPLMDEILLVTSPDAITYCREEIVEKYQLTKVSQVLAGGKERYDSVYQGLRACQETCQGTDYVFIHDGARPFITGELLARGYETVRKYGTAIAGMPSKDTIKLVDSNGRVEETPSRDRVWLVQTPQIFAYDVIRAAYDRLQTSCKEGITDDAMVVERLSQAEVHMFPGDYRNIKITTPEDLEIAKVFLK